MSIDYIAMFLCVGDIELANGLPTYMQTVICEQQTEAFAIDLRNYDRLVTRRHAFTGRLIAQTALLKLTNRAIRFSHIPLLSAMVKTFNSQPQDSRHKQIYLTYQRYSWSQNTLCDASVILYPHVFTSNNCVFLFYTAALK